MRKIVCILFVFFTTLAALSQNAVGDMSLLRSGDLLFHVPGNGNNITDVTSAGKDMATDHVAIFVRIEGVPLVIDATSRGVAVRRADSLIFKGENYVYVRIKKLDCSKSINNALQFLGRPYDYKFYSDDAEIYCSELVQKSFVDKDGRPLFNTIPMSFHDASGKVTDYWKNYYRTRWGAQVPEGEEGTNPADIYMQALRLK